MTFFALTSDARSALISSPLTLAEIILIVLVAFHSKTCQSLALFNTTIDRSQLNVEPISCYVSVLCYMPWRVWDCLCHFRNRLFLFDVFMSEIVFSVIIVVHFRSFQVEELSMTSLASLG